MKGLSELMVIVVTVIVILIAAFVLVTIFGKGLTGVVDTSETVRATGQCGFRCAYLCQITGTKTGEPTSNGVNQWTKETVKIGDNPEPCSKYAVCDCGKPVDTTTKSAG